jgi:hypothetical protein
VLAEKRQCIGPNHATTLSHNLDQFSGGRPGRVTPVGSESG